MSKDPHDHYEYDDCDFDALKERLILVEMRLTFAEGFSKGLKERCDEADARIEKLETLCVGIKPGAL